MHDHADQFEMGDFDGDAPDTDHRSAPWADPRDNHAAGWPDECADEGGHFRICGRCGARTTPRRSESSCLEEARRYGWRRVAATDRPGARRIDLCGLCAAEAGYGPPLAQWG